jgi:hypothetical protein
MKRFFLNTGNTIFNNNIWIGINDAPDMENFTANKANKKAIDLASKCVSLMPKS